jgi:dephospho-CoA kinase
VRPVTVAITGGIAAGKSEALAAFARRGAETISSDEIVHAALAKDDEVRAAIRERWGDDAVGNRKRIAEIVFNDPVELEWLERLLHPVVRRVVDELIETRTGRLFAVEIPLLYETGGESRFDKVVVITAPSEARGARRTVADARESRLIPDEEKMERADFSFVNDGSLEALDAFVAGVVENLLSSSAA